MRSAPASFASAFRAGVSMSGGYYRNWFGSFLVTDNTLLTPSDFNTYCVTAPLDSRH